MDAIVIKRNGHLIEYEPIVKDCTYHNLDENGKCRNCNNTGKFVAGYYMIIDKKFGFAVDTIK